MVVIDRLSKYVHFSTLKSEYSSKQVAKTNNIKVYGFPKTIVSNSYKVSTSEFWQQLFKLSGTKLNMTTIMPSTIRWAV